MIYVLVTILQPIFFISQQKKKRIKKNRIYLPAMLILKDRVRGKETNDFFYL